MSGVALPEKLPNAVPFLPKPAGWLPSLLMLASHGWNRPSLVLLPLPPTTKPPAVWRAIDAKLADACDPGSGVYSSLPGVVAVGLKLASNAPLPSSLATTPRMSVEVALPTAVISSFDPTDTSTNTLPFVPRLSCATPVPAAPNVGSSVPGATVTIAVTVTSWCSWAADATTSSVSVCVVDSVVSPRTVSVPAAEPAAIVPAVTVTPAGGAGMSSVTLQSNPADGVTETARKSKPSIGTRGAGVVTVIVKSLGAAAAGVDAAVDRGVVAAARRLQAEDLGAAAQRRQERDRFHRTATVTGTVARRPLRHALDRLTGPAQREARVGIARAVGEAAHRLAVLRARRHRRGRRGRSTVTSTPS